MSRRTEVAGRRSVSGWLQRLAEVTAGARLTAGIAAVVVVWLVAYAIAGFPTWMATTLELLAAAVTLVMVFVLQHTQRRLETATQLKLDELVRATDADDRFAAIEAAGDDELDRHRVGAAPGHRATGSA